MSVLGDGDSAMTCQGTGQVGGHRNRKSPRRAGSMCNPPPRRKVRPVMSSLLRRIERAAERDTTITFVVGGDEDVVSWRDLHLQARGYAAALQARGVCPGDRVALLSPTTRELVTAIQATWLAGAAIVVRALAMRVH